MSNFLFELEDDTRVAVAEEEKAKHEVVWLSLEEIKAEDMRHAEIHFLLERIESPEKAYTEKGILFNSGVFTGRTSDEVVEDIVTAVGGELVTNYRIRDWLVSRQRYWGCPIPIVYDPEGKAHLVPPEHLPWTLPTDVDFTPTGKYPLRVQRNFTIVSNAFLELGGRFDDTLDVFVDSAWYYLRYLDPHGAMISLTIN